MRLNFWQWLGLVLLIGAGAFWIYEQQAEQSPAPQGAPPVIAPTTIPADPATGPAAP